MSILFWRRPVPFLVLLAVCGCGSPPMVQVDTILHGDGSCDRSIWQPRDEMLPADAFSPVWNTRWKSIKFHVFPPELTEQAGNGRPNGERHYFFAQGSFRSPADIPAHFRFAFAEGRDAQASELVRVYECKDYGFVREHRWRETLTNIVTRERFLKARDQFLDRALPKVILGIETIYGKSFDVTRLTQYLQKDGRQFLEQAALVFYETMAQHVSDGEQPLVYAELARQFGVDLLTPAGSLVADEEGRARLMSFLRHRIALGMRHRDGSRLTEPEIRSILDPKENSKFSQSWDEYWKQHQKEFETQLVPLIYQMTGFYNAPFAWSQTPRFAFDLRMPGQVVAASGTVDVPDHVRWRFSGDRSFPDGFVMQARSLEIDLEEQKRILGREAITATEEAKSYVELLEEDGHLLDAMRAVRAAGNLDPLLNEQPRTAEGQSRLQRLRAMLGPA